MIKKIELSKKYIQIKRENGDMSFGGNQHFFYGAQLSEIDQRKKSYGCGIVAFADLILYMGNSDRKFLTAENADYVNCELSEAGYKEYFNCMYDFIGGIIRNFGVSGLTIAMKFNKLARRNGWKLRAKWGFSRKKLFPRIEEMLQKNLPVILCIPVMLLKKDREDMLALYVRRFDDVKKKYQYQAAMQTNAHYVTVTGIWWEDEKIYLAVSSWGREYYIDFEEYDTYISTHLLGKILGNILYVQ